MSDPSGSTVFSWTGGDQLASEDGPWSSDTVSYAYNCHLPGSVSLAQPNASPWVQTFGFDHFTRLTNITSAAGVFGYLYDEAPFGAPTDVVRGLALLTGATEWREHDDLARLTRTTLYRLGSAVDDYRYTYDQGSQRTRQDFSAGNYMLYTYDNRAVENGQGV
jgi:hypothetical protein